MCVYVYVCVCVCIYIYIYIYGPRCSLVCSSRACHLRVDSRGRACARVHARRHTFDVTFAAESNFHVGPRCSLACVCVCVCVYYTHMSTHMPPPVSICKPRPEAVRGHRARSESCQRACRRSLATGLQLGWGVSRWPRGLLFWRHERPEKSAGGRESVGARHTNRHTNGQQTDRHVTRGTWTKTAKFEQSCVHTHTHTHTHVYANTHTHTRTRKCARQICSFAPVHGVCTCVCAYKH